MQVQPGQDIGYTIFSYSDVLSPYDQFVLGCNKTIGEIHPLKTPYSSNDKRTYCGKKSGFSSLNSGPHNCRAITIVSSFKTLIWRFCSRMKGRNSLWKYEDCIIPPQTGEHMSQENTWSGVH